MGDVTRTAGVKAECLLFIVIASVTTCLRVISRTQSKAGLWWDDYLSILAFVCPKHRPKARATIVSILMRMSWIVEKNGLIKVI